MAVPDKQRSLYIAGGALVILVLIVVFVAVRLGGAYQSGLSEIGNQPQSDPLTLRKTKKIQKITIQTPDQESCIEVTPDGVVRIFDVCDGDLSQVSRISNTKNIQELYRRLSYIDLDTYETPLLNSGIAYTLQIQTDSGTYTIIIVEDDDEGSDLIDSVIEDIPDVSPTPLASIPGVSPSSTSQPGVNPTPQASGSVNPSASPVVGGGDNPFICDYHQDESGKPYRVSNIVCTDEPQAP